MARAGDVHFWTPPVAQNHIASMPTWGVWTCPRTVRVILGTYPMWWCPKTCPNHHELGVSENGITT
eukprot:10263165-Lingulodinium_polyedra.AAC.1